MSSTVARVVTLVAVAIFAWNQGANAQTVRGELVDGRFGHPLSDVVLTLVVAGGERVATTETDSAGIFVLTADSSGSYRIRAQKAGFRPAVSNVLRLVSGDTMSVEMRLLDSVVILDSVTVEAPGSDRPFLAAAFYERLAADAHGIFITRADIQAAQAARTTELLRNIPGMQFTPTRGDGFVTRGRANCAPTVYIDGTRALMTNMTIDDLVRPMEIEGIEVYRSISEAPPQYQGLRAGCSAILVWTRIGRR